MFKFKFSLLLFLLVNVRSIYSVKNLKDFLSDAQRYQLDKYGLFDRTKAYFVAEKFLLHHSPLALKRSLKSNIDKLFSDPEGLVSEFQICRALEDFSKENKLKLNLYWPDNYKVFDCVSRGDIKLLRALIKEGVPVNSYQIYYDNPLVVACKHNQTDMIKFLVDHFNMSESGRECIGQALTQLSLHGQYRAVEFLVEHGADISFRVDGYTALTAAISSVYRNKPHKDLIKFVLSKLQESEAGRQNIDEVLIHSLGAGCFSELILLMSCGLDINYRGENGNTMLIRAAGYNQVGAIEFLLDNGADASILNDCGETALTVATKHSCQSAIKFLTEHVASKF